ncbi:STAS domain-containing protein [Nostocoides sp. HKS02]|uniref:STAS domain-containing protein n=1 Tax=Nostocoides sp. HKS02 TaxID=1813880 RepID=UPI0012B4FF98|nr:STAS domain-containing protein [Tetrasphaera sp. HKS02]QGN58910.1 STAS domain-containing protein [Tetrasphaera sp. HKS02]
MSWVNHLSDARGPSPLRATHADHGPVWVVDLLGEADLATWDILQEELDRAARMDRDKVVLDLSRLRFCDVHCAQLILAAGATTRLAIAGASGPVRRVFEVLDPAQRMPRYLGMAEATAVP